MIDNNPIFSQENIKRLASYISDKAYTLRYDSNDTEEQYDAAEKLSLINYLMAHLADHFFGYFPASYFINDEQRNAFKDFIDDLKQDPMQILEMLIGFVDDAFDELDCIEYPEDEIYRKPKRDAAIEEDVVNFLVEIHKNFGEFHDRLFAPAQNQDKTKPTETRVRVLLNTISKIQDYMLTQGESHNQLDQAFQYSKMLEMFKLPLLFGWEQYKYGWHSDFWKEGDSMLEYDMFLFNANDHLQNCIATLTTDSPFKYFERNGQITNDLIEILTDISNRLSSGEFKII
ncbi:MAG: hypothetical protein K2M13_10070 [Muribaculaceae bacterium]|nr:hypothetical protein [Muribaculaceae bacterium]